MRCVERQARVGEVGDDAGGARGRVVQAQRAEAVRLEDAAVRELVEADRLLQVRRRADLRLLVVAQDGGAAVAVGRVARARRPADRALEVRGQRGVEGRGRVAEPGVERAAAAVVLAERDRVMGAHRAALDPVERRALRLRPERVLDHGREHVRDAPDVGREVVPVVVALPVEREALARVMDAVEDLHRARLQRRPARRTRAEHLGEERPRRVGLDRGADADEASALAEVRLEVGLLGGRERARLARVQEDHRAVGLQLLRRELRADRGGRGRRDRERVAGRSRVDGVQARGRDRVVGTRDHEHLRRRGGLCRRGRRRRIRQRESKAQQRQASESPPHSSPPRSLSRTMRSGFVAGVAKLTQMRIVCQHDN